MCFEKRDFGQPFLVQIDILIRRRDIIRVDLEASCSKTYIQPIPWTSTRLSQRVAIRLTVLMYGCHSGLQAGQQGMYGEATHVASGLSYQNDTFHA
jgi:hypothetical protein